VKKDVLPDSRLRESKGAIQSPLGMWVPIFCANCGTEGGAVPVENTTFAFWLCTPCAETHGHIAGTMMMPDEVFFELLKEEQLEAYGRFLTEQELADVVAADASPLATLLKEGR
jgi:hypothetical protein